MKFWKRRSFRIAVAVAVGLVFVQFGTYFAYGRRTMPQVALKRSVRKASYIVVEGKSWGGMSAKQRASLTGWLGEYAGTIYHAREEVPVERTVREANTDREMKTYQIVATQNWRSPEAVAELKKIAEAPDHFHHFVDGYELGWECKGEGLFWMRSWVTYTSGFDDSAGDDSTYVWVLGFWVRVRNDGGYVT